MSTVADPREIFDGVTGCVGDWLPEAPLILSAERYSKLGAVAERLAVLLLEACRRRATTAGELLTALGTTRREHRLVEPDDKLDERLLAALRPDVVVERGTPRFVEFNIDSSLGGLPQVDVVAARYLARLGGGGSDGPGLVAPPSALDARAATIRDTLGLPAGSRVVIPLYPVGAYAGLTDYAKFAEFLAPVCRHATAFGLHMTTHPLHRLTLGAGGRLMAGAEPVDAVFRTFVAHAQPDSAGFQALRDALRAGTARMFTSEAAMLLGNKRTMAWLWSDLDLLDATDRELVRKHLPYSAAFGAGAEADERLHAWALSRRGELVLKPTAGFGGDGVVIGPAVPGQAWRAALDRARVEGFVVQQYVAGDDLPLGFVHRVTGERVDAAVPYVLGPFLFGGRPTGVLVRHGTPGGGGVLNVRQGAFMSAALVTGDVR